jgi:hypothetical protein
MSAQSEVGSGVAIEAAMQAIIARLDGLDAKMQLL